MNAKTPDRVAPLYFDDLPVGEIATLLGCSDGTVKTHLARGRHALAELLGRARRQLKASGASTEAVDWAGLLDGPLPGLVAAGRTAEAEGLVEAATGLTLEA